MGALGCQHAWPKCGQLARNVGGRKTKEGGVGLIEKERAREVKRGRESRAGEMGRNMGERERVKEISELTQP